MTACGVCGGWEIGAHHHEPECRECGADFGEYGSLDVDETGAPYCVGCGADPREGVAWSTSSGLVVVIPDAETVTREAREDRDYCEAAGW